MFVNVVTLHIFKCTQTSTSQVSVLLFRSVPVSTGAVYETMDEVLHALRHNCTSVTYLTTTLSFVKHLDEHGQRRLKNVPVSYIYETTIFYCCAIVGISIVNHSQLLEMFQSNNRYLYTA